MNFKDIITIYGFPLTIIGALIGVASFFYSRIKEAQAKGENEGRLDAQLSYIQAQLTDILIVVKKHEELNYTLTQTLAMLESQVKVSLRLGDEARDRDKEQDAHIKNIQDALGKINLELGFLQHHTHNDTGTGTGTGTGTHYGSVIDETNQSC